MESLFELILIVLQQKDGQTESLFSPCNQKYVHDLYVIFKSDIRSEEGSTMETLMNELESLEF
jgi:hypothetical protein